MSYCGLGASGWQKSHFLSATRFLGVTYEVTYSANTGKSLKTNEVLKIMHIGLSFNWGVTKTLQHVERHLPYEITPAV